MPRFTEAEETTLLMMSDLVATLGPSNLAKLKRMHQVRGRYYHTWDHALNVLRATLQLNLGEVGRLAHALAAVFHDSIYVVGATDNEKRSADLLLSMCKGHLDDSVMYAADLIMATANHGISTVENTAQNHRDFLDCDILSIAELCWPIAVQNDWNVTAEYVAKHTPEEVTMGRRNFLREWLQKPSVFLGQAHGRANEWQARQNIHRLLEVKHDFSMLLEPRHAHGN